MHAVVLLDTCIIQSVLLCTQWVWNFIFCKFKQQSASALGKREVRPLYPAAWLIYDLAKNWGGLASPQPGHLCPVCLMTQTLKCCPTKQFARCTYYFAPVLLGHLVYVQCPVFQASVILLIILVVLELFQDITGKAWHILYVAYNMWHPLDLFNNWAIWCLSSLPKCLDRSQASKLLSNIT